MPAYKQQPLHRVLVKDSKGIEEIHSFGTLDLAMKFAERITDGTAKYFGPDVPKKPEQYE